MLSKLILLVVFAAVVESAWQSYVDSELIGSGSLAKGAIFKTNGDVLAKADNFKIAPEEAKQFAELMTDPSMGHSHPPVIEGVKYELIFTKPTVAGRHGSAGFVAQKTSTVIVLGLYGENQSASEAQTIVDHLAHYIRGTEH